MVIKPSTLILFSSLLVLILGSMNFVQAVPCDTYERDNGKTICVSEYTAVKLMDRGWEITKIIIEPVVEKTIEVPTALPTVVPTEKVPQVNQTVQVTEITPIENNISKNTTKQTPEIKQNIPVIPSESNTNGKKTGWIWGEEDLSYMQLEKIPNPTGFWTPIEDKDEFAQLLVNATGDKIISVSLQDFYDSFTTKNGNIRITDYFIMSSGIYPAVEYGIHESIQDESEQLEFINNFMKNMGFKFNDGVPLTVKFLETCDGNFAHYSCLSGDEYLSTNFGTNGTIYSLSQKYGNVTFHFFDDSYVKYGMPGIHIKFNGWTNNPELVNITLSSKESLKISDTFATTNKELNKPVSQGGKCEFELNDDYERVHLPKNDNYTDLDFINIIAGVPFYINDGGRCTFDQGATTFDFPKILVDAWTGEHVFLIYVSGLD